MCHVWERMSHTERHFPFLHRSPDSSRTFSVFQNLDVHFHVTPALAYFPAFFSLSLFGDASGLFQSDLYAVARFIAKSVLSENAAQ